ncbi:taurine catabolism dioxygenase family protein [Eremomyces bilateralis CBS 781.70]|uniref:Taurine catabolism dioxygenase family protein n=1 Tax=Eremomyces bilateralis CBS 781.70 TaxID=1392243 RepID=A0A6G1FTW6_9PEZI|nr:taurine catabolism dioxygenase family protein [Eremomyces bilateralis CBS 781.70]KAF1809132.1 taurine catabolism dioxygenase family protein [Eremomyces bilateralis CBS 781.70]
MATVDTLPSYDLWSDAPGYLLNKPEWEAANASHPASFSFGDVPKGWPSQITGPSVWTGDDLRRNPDSYLRILKEEEIEEIDTAIKAWKQLSIPQIELSRSNFPLPTLGPVLRQLANNIYNGTGLQILRGFPIAQYSTEDQMIAFLGINAWIGDQKLNQGAQRAVCHIKSIAHLDPSQRGKIYVSAQDTNPQMYHSDAGGDIVGLMAVSTSGKGGRSKVASAAQVYNHLAKHRPDIARILAEHKFRWQAVGIPKDGVRLIHYQDGKLFLNFSTRTFIGYGEVPDRDTNFPELTFEEREVFGGWQWVADQYSFSTELQTGDIEWVNNLHHQHARFGFTEDPSNPRHLLRVWLRDSELSPKKPADMQNKFDAMFGVEPNLVPVDELEEDVIRKSTGIFTGSCEKALADYRLEKGGIGALNKKADR